MLIIGLTTFTLERAYRKFPVVVTTCEGKLHNET